jgi:DNA polymerase V
MLMELQTCSVQQGELDLEGDDSRDRGKLMVAMDGLNQRYVMGASFRLIGLGLAVK